MKTSCFGLDTTKNYDSRSYQDLIMISEFDQNFSYTINKNYESNQL